MPSVIASALLLFAAASAGAADVPVPVAETCRELARRLASVKLEDCTGAGLHASDLRSVQGRAILWRDYEPAPGREAERRVLLIGGVHGDEFSSVSIVFRWMRQLAQDGDRRMHWRVIPSLNPDGLLRRPATRVNANGVDLNRNFPSPDWESGALSYWRERTRSDARRYPGATPASEPETRLLVGEIERFRPDVIVSIHAPYGILDYDGPHSPPERLGYLLLHPLGTYPGSLGRYAGQYLDLPVVTLELPYAGIMPTSAQSRQMWADLELWLDRSLPARAVATPASSPEPAGAPEAGVTAGPVMVPVRPDTAAPPAPAPIVDVLDTALPPALPAGGPDEPPAEGGTAPSSGTGSTAAQP